MKTQILSTLLLLLLSHYLSAQQLSGNVVQDNGEAVPFATVSLHEAVDSSLVNGTSTDMEGLFTLPDIEPGKYYLKISSIGYLSKMPMRLSKKPQV